MTLNQHSSRSINVKGNSTIVSHR